MNPRHNSLDVRCEVNNDGSNVSMCQTKKVPFFHGKMCLAYTSEVSYENKLDFDVFYSKDVYTCEAKSSAINQMELKSE